MPYRHQIKQETIEQAEFRIKEATDKAKAAFPEHDIAYPQVKFDRIGACTGKANPSRNIILLNVDLIEQDEESYNYMMNTTIPHEVSHIVDYILHGLQHKYTRRGYQRILHGPTWKAIMINVMGINPKRCHNLDVSNTNKRKMRKFEYACDCKVTHKVSPQIHAKMIKGQRRMCKSCRAIIGFTGNEIAA